MRPTGKVLCSAYTGLVPVVHCKKEPFDVYIGRPSRWGNPYSHQPETIARYRVETREEAIEAYKQHLWREIRGGRISLKELAELDGKTLGCWCSPKACHGEVLLEFADWARQALEADWGSAEQPFWRPGPNPVVDCVITRGGRQKILLIKRSSDPGTAEAGKWALPGGFWDTYAGRGQPWRPGRERSREAAARELAEETGLEGGEISAGLEYVGRFDRFGRDPRDNPVAWSVSDAFRLELPEGADATVMGGDDAEEAVWADVGSLDQIELAFDHREIIGCALAMP